MRTEYSSHDWERGSDDVNYRRRESNDYNQNNRPQRRNYNNQQRNSEENRRRPYNAGNSYQKRDRNFNSSENSSDNPFGRRLRKRVQREGYNTNERRSYSSDRPRPAHRREEREYEGMEKVYNSRPLPRVRRNEREDFGKPSPKFQRPRLRKDNPIKTKPTKKAKGPNFTPPNPENIGKTRLNKYIANAGVCSRREADVLITTGVITVNDVVVTEMGYKVLPGDVVKYNGNPLKSEKKIYILLNKPKGYITTADDPQQRKTVMELIEGACSERVYPVGRLDRNTTGLLLLTNDGDLTKKLTHPSFGAQKVYNVELDTAVSKGDMLALLKGIELEDGVQKVDAIDYTNAEPIDKKKVGVSIHSGKNRIIRRLFESLGYEVVKLDRVYFAGLTKKNLLRGHYRFLTEKEVAFLKMDR
ncbi:MAG: pseudouridine synthase [Bacteroidales bacterium]|nr:pseudouridine synthase [Bacteroidales bacterium]